MYHIFNYIKYLPIHSLLLFLYSFVLHNDYCVLIVITHQCIIYRYRSLIITSCYMYTHCTYKSNWLKFDKLLEIAWYSIPCVVNRLVVFIFCLSRTGKDYFCLIYVKRTNKPGYLLKHFLFSPLFLYTHNRPSFSLLTLVDDIIGRRRRGEPFCEQMLVTNQEYSSKRFTSELRGFNHGTVCADAVFLKGPENY